MFDRQLWFTAHIRSTALRANSRLHLLRKCVRTLSTWSSHRLQGICPPNIRVLTPSPPPPLWCRWVHLRPLWISWTLCNAVHSISLAPSTACRAFHIVVMWQPGPTFSNFYLAVPSPLYSVLPVLDTASALDIPSTRSRTRHQQYCIHIISVVKFTPTPVIALCEHSQQD